MKLSDARIKSGDIIAFSHGDFQTIKGWQTEGVRFIERSTYSHVAVAVVKDGKVYIYQAIEPETVCVPLAGVGECFWLSCNFPWTQAAQDFAEARLGVKYSKLDAMRNYLLPVRPDDCQECAAFAIAIHHRNGVDLGDMARPDDVVKAALKQDAVLTLVEA